MATNDPTPVPSKAAIGGHPVHPMLVPFPIAFLVGMLVTDIVNRVTGNPFWAEASYWLGVGGLAMGALAALFGLIDFAGRAAIRQLSIARTHFIGNALVLVLALINVMMRVDDPAAPVSAGQLALSAIVTGILAVTGWLGGEMAYRHRIGVTSTEAAAAAEAAAHPRRGAATR